MDKKKIEVELYRQDGKTFFKFRVDPRITAMYSTGEVRESNNWPGLKFYYLPEIVEDQNYRDMLYNFKLKDSYGSGLIDGKILNIAWIRTVTGEGTIEIKNTLPFAELSQMIRNTMDFLKNYFQEYYRDFKIKGNINIEL